MPFFFKVFAVKELKQLTVIGLGLLGYSLLLAAARAAPTVRLVGYSRRALTRRRARRGLPQARIVERIEESVEGSDLVILASPICTFEKIFKTIGPLLPPRCVVTDVGSTKVMPHRWAAGALPPEVFYTGSHPIAGSEKKGIEYARADLFDRSICILTGQNKRAKAALVLKRFWSALNCSVVFMSPARHDRILAGVSHLPHVVAATLINSLAKPDLAFGGAGLCDTSRVASGPSDVWTDVILTNSGNLLKAMDRFACEWSSLRQAVARGDRAAIERSLRAAGRKRLVLTGKKEKAEEVL